MAKVQYGGPVANASGSIAGVVFSHNRYGSYMRRRSVPVKATTEYALNAKSRLSTASSGWRSLTTAQKDAWRTWASSNPITDTLGEKQVLTGQAAYVRINTRRLLDGTSALAVPPIVPAPVGLTTLTLEADIGAGDFEINYTPTPIPAGHKLWVQAAVVDSEGINYVQNLLKLVTLSAAAQASPFDPQSAIEARFGTLAVDQKVVVLVSIYAVATGLLSQPMRAEAVVVST